MRPINAACIAASYCARTIGMPSDWNAPPRSLSSVQVQRVATVMGVIALAAYTLYRFREAILTFYVLDDFWVLRDANRIEIQSLWDLQQFFWFAHPGFLLYRPLTTTAYSYLLQSLFDFDPSGHHAFQLVVFTFNVLLVVGIVSRMTHSAIAGLSAGLLYVLAPGQAVNAYWLSAFTVLGTALWNLLMLWCWLTLRGWTRIVVCTLLQVCGLLASEHAIAAPVLCAIVAFVRKESWRSAAVALAPSTALVAAYSISKLLYLRTVRSGIDVYTVNFTPTAMLQELGQYLCACFNVLALQQLGAAANIAIGVAVVVMLALSAAAAVRGSDAARLVAAGIAMFGVSLAPVLVLKAHYYDHYICTAALGAVLAVVGCCQLLTHQWRWVLVGFSAALLIFDVQTGEQAWRANGVFRLVVNGSMGTAGWIDAVQRATTERTEPFAVLIPVNIVTNSIFVVGQANTFLPGMPARIIRYYPTRAPIPTPQQVAVPSGSPIRFGEPLPYWDPRREWLRRLAGAQPNAGRF